MDFGKFALLSHWFLIVYLLAVGAVFGVCDFLDAKCTLQGPKCRDLVFS